MEEQAETVTCVLSRHPSFEDQKRFLSIKADGLAMDARIVHYAKTGQDRWSELVVTFAPGNKDKVLQILESWHSNGLMSAPQE
jgi:hypothetical protein